MDKNSSKNIKNSDEMGYTVESTENSGQNMIYQEKTEQTCLNETDVLLTSPELNEPNKLVINTQNPELDEIIYKALKKVKDYFFSNEMEEQKLADFMFKILTMNINDMSAGENVTLNPEVLDQLVDEMIENHQSINSETYAFNDIIENLFGEETAIAIAQKIASEKVDVIVERLLGKDTKNLICTNINDENLDELLEKLIDDKLKANVDPEAKHPNFDDIIDKILGKDTEEFIRMKLENFVGKLPHDSYYNDNIDALEIRKHE